MAKWQCKRDVVGVVVVVSAKYPHTPSNSLWHCSARLDSIRHRRCDFIDGYFVFCSYLVHIMTECMWYFIGYPFQSTAQQMRRRSPPILPSSRYHARIHSIVPWSCEFCNGIYWRAFGADCNFIFCRSQFALHR